MCACFNLLHVHAHHGGLVIAMEDVDKICNGQHTCVERHLLHLGKYCNGQKPKCDSVKYSPVLPTNVCNLLSHKSAALKSFATSAKKAFFTFESIEITQIVDLWAGKVDR